MKAKYEARKNLDRKKLEQHIPIKTPYVLFVDPSDACNFKCNFCPTSDRELMKQVERPWKQMSLEIFKKIIDDLKYFDEKVEVLRLYKDGEPLLNKNLPEMIKYAKDSGYVGKIDTTTNASLLTRSRGEQLVNSGLDRINISIYGVNDSQYKKFSNTQIKFDIVLENVKNFYEIRGNCEMLVKVNGDSLTSDEKQEFLDKFGDYTDKIYIEHTMSCWPEFELKDSVENAKYGLYGQQIKEVLTCPYPFYSMSVNSDGIVSTCFLDWARKLTIGDVREMTIKEIWTGVKMRAYQKMFLEGGRKEHEVCGKCGQMSHGSPDDIDNDAKLILNKLNNMNYFEGVKSKKIINLAKVN